MRRKRMVSVIIFLIGFFLNGNAQDISLYQQFNGRYDFTFFGNSMNTVENNSIYDYVTVTESSATLTMNPDDVIEKAFLYWAGSGDGDFEVNLNGELITPDRTFSYSRIIQDNTFTYFSSFKDDTTQIQTTGNGNYTLSNLDISTYEDYHLMIRTNFAGWAIIIVYKNDVLPLNQVNVYDGLQGVPDDLIINLDNLNVIDNNDSKVGFLAWEGDSLLATETFTFNGNPLSNTLNPVNNVFNSTNSITGSTTLNNMDLDIYSLENNIEIGDTSAEIKLSSYQDFIMVNTVITKLNNQLPDATIIINSIENECDSRIITAHFTVYNLNATNPLPSGIPIAVYANGEFIEFTETILPIEIGGNWNSQITINVPSNIPDSFTLLFVVDDNGAGIGHVTEVNEYNNSFSTEVTLLRSPTFNTLEPLITCNMGFTKAVFDFSSYSEIVKVNPNDIVQFFDSFDKATANVNPILIPSNYQAATTPKEIFIRIENQECFSVTSFDLLTRNCPPTIYNYISANDDTINDVFTIDGLRDIFLTFEIEIYNRWGKLLWTGNQNSEDWNGYVKEGIGLKKATDGTYFYLLFLNDKDYPQPLTGFLYINH
ncbi:T9SS type B sorting domain-containing protein [Flavobacterium sp.]